jgi:pyruvate dehydrogenase E1 component alpha subunit
MESLSENILLEAYKNMLLIRKFEEKCKQLYLSQMISGFCHLYIGQEAVATACKMSKQPIDCVITSYRCHGHAILFGCKPKYVMSELLGKSTGSSKGKGGSMHIFNRESNFYGGHGIVGAQVPIGTGIAFTQKYQNTGAVCYTFLGDGAANQGQVFESFNMAKLWKLPIIYIIENNEYSMGTSVARSTAVTDLCTRGKSFDIKGISANGMDFHEMHQVLREARDYVSKNDDPIIIEAKTYRYVGHSMSDPAKYRTRNELDSYKNIDPIQKIKNVLKKDIATEIEKEIKKIVAEAEHFAMESPEPMPQELYTEIYTK